MKSANTSIEDLRKQIDKIDADIFNLLLQRLEVVKRVGEVKKQTDNHKSIIRPAREAMMVKNIYSSALSKGLPENIALGFAYIWRQIISVAINLEEPTNISFLDNSEGEYINYAREYFGIFSKFTGQKNSSDILKDIQNGKSNIAIFPIVKNEVTKPWWLDMSEKYYQFSVFCGFPFFEGVNGNNKSGCNSLAIANITAEPCGDDVFVYVLKGKLPQMMADNFEVVSQFDNYSLLFSRETFNDDNSKLDMKYIGCFAVF